MAAPLHPDPNYRSPKYSIARTATRCWHCGQSTRVLALLLPDDHETLDPDRPKNRTRGSQRAATHFCST